FRERLNVLAGTSTLPPSLLSVGPTGQPSAGTPPCLRLRALLEVSRYRAHALRALALRAAASLKAIGRSPHTKFHIHTNCTDMLPSGPKSATKVSPLFAQTGRVKAPASIMWPGSSVTPNFPTLLASHAMPIAGCPITPAANPVSSISEF